MGYNMRANFLANYQTLSPGQPAGAFLYDVGVGAHQASLGFRVLESRERAHSRPRSGL